MHTDTGTHAIVCTRTDTAPADTDEIRALATAAGYEVVDALSQVRPEDSGTYVGRGKVEELAARIEETPADTAVVDGALTPTQYTNLVQALPDGTAVLDRYRLVLDIFADQANEGRAQLQVELARLEYELPRMRETADEQMLNRFTESGTPVYDYRDRIDRLKRKLNELPDPTDEFRRRRREQGFDLVTLAGYTNAGKSTLLHRLADGMSLASADPLHPDEDPVAAVEDRLFKTLETTTRRATLDGRPTLVTDTVGYVSDLPHWLVESFSETLSEAAAADVVVLVVDGSDPREELLEKLTVSLDVLDAQGVDEATVLPVLNKVDLLSETARSRRAAAVADVASTPTCVSAVAGTNLDRLRSAIRDRLPTERTDLAMPNCDRAMRVVSWAYDHATVEDVTYDASEVRLSLRGRPGVIERARAKSAAVGE